MTVDADEVNDIRNKFSDLTDGHDPQALVFATVDFLAAQLAAHARIESPFDFEWAVRTLASMAREKGEMLKPRLGEPLN